MEHRPLRRSLFSSLWRGGGAVGGSSSGLGRLGQEDCPKFKASLCYRVSSREAWDPERNIVSKGRKRIHLEMKKTHSGSYCYIAVLREESETRQRKGEERGTGSRERPGHAGTSDGPRR